METIVRDLMTSPAVTCTSTDSLAVAARLMREADTGSVIVTELGKVVGILTERDLLRAAATSAGPEHEPVSLWMTAHPDVLRPGREGRRGLGQPDRAPLPAPAGGRRRRAGRCGLSARPHGRGPHPPGHRDERRRPGRARRCRGGRDHGGRRARPGGLLPLPAVLRRRPGRAAFPRRRVAPALPGRAARRVRPRPPSPRRCGAAAQLPPGLAALLPGTRPGRARRSTCCAAPSPCSGAELGWRPTLDIDAERAVRPGARAVRRGPDHSGCRPPAPRRARAGRPPGRSRLRRQLPLHADRTTSRAERTPGPSSST